jgi:RNA polymerase sigma-32 factor
MSTALQLMNTPLPVLGENINAYMHGINQLALLSKEEEYALALRYQDHNDLGAAQQLVLGQLRYVVRIARGYSGYGLGLADLVQEGTIGLMKAVKRFDPRIGVRLVSFAVHWIKSEIHEFIIRNWRIVKIATTKAQRKLFFNIRKSKKRLGWFSHDEVQGVAKDLGVTPKEVLEMEKRLNAYDLAFDLEGQDEDEGRALAPAEYLTADHCNNPSEQIENRDTTACDHQQLAAALEQLDSRSQEIVKSRWLTDEKTTLKYLAQRFEISIERVRQLENSAMKALRHCLQAPAA